MRADEPAPLIANVEQADAWDGAEGDHWAEHADRYEQATRRHRERLLSADLIHSADDVLDIGCGTGALTRAAARRAPGGSALGVDLSSRMVSRARALAASEGITNARFERADAEVHPFAAESVDTVVSSFGAMFFGDPAHAFTNIARALRPGGHMGLLVWRDLTYNPWVSALRDALAIGRVLPAPPPGAPGPFGLADAERSRDVLEGAGMAAVEFTEVSETVDFGATADEAYTFVSGVGFVEGLTTDLEPHDTAHALDALRAALASAETDAGVLFDSSAWLITAQRK